MHAGLADAAFLTWAGARTVHVVRGVEVMAKKPGVAVTRDFEQDLVLEAGQARLSGSARMQSGRSWSYERQVEYGVGLDGSIGKQVDFSFSGNELRHQVEAVLKETGWYPGWVASLPSEAKVALFVALIGGVAAIAGAVLAIVA